MYSKLSNQNRSVTPTYQALLILSLDTVAKRLMDGDLTGGWQALKTLYSEFPSDCQKGCLIDVQEIEKNLARIDSYEGITYAETEIVKLSNTRNYLVTATLDLFNEIKNTLHAKGYLEFTSIKPRNPKPEALGEMVY